MTEINSSSSPCNLSGELMEDQNPNPTHLSSSIYTTSPQTSSSSSLSCHIIFNKSSTLLNDYHKDILQQPQSQQQADNYDLHGGSYNIENESESESGLKFSIWKKQVMMTNANANNQSSESNTNSNIQLKWMSSKMRLMNKMKNNNSNPTAANTSLMKPEDQKQQDSSSVSPTSPSNNTTIRVCSDCNTTKTPLWRSGPRGPKSLCNACGIRQRKARRATAAAAAAAATATATNGTILLSERSPIKISKVQHKEKQSNGPKYKKRCKIVANTSHSRKELRFEEFLMSLSKNLALHRMFPQDEKEAAILLMALSCGHIHG